MSQSSAETPTAVEAESPTDIPPSHRRRRPQFGLFTIMLLVLAVASWAAYWQANSELTRMRTALPGLREISRQLQVNDPAQYAVVRHHELWDDDFRWRVYLPPGYRHRLRLATKEIGSRGELAEPIQQREIAASEHEVELRYEKTGERWQISVIVDGQKVLTDEQPAAWNAGWGSSGGPQFSKSEQQALGQPLELFRRRFMVPTDPKKSGSSATTPQGSCDGILLWIESEPV